MERMRQLERTGLFDAMVPRYTSYPTAPHFRDDDGLGSLGTWAGELDADADISLYLHIPFCERLCWFCACRTQGVRSPEPVARYLDVLKQEAASVAAALPQGPKVRRIHWGGGTPTILTPEQITDLAGTLRDAFPIADSFEFSVEIDPTLVNRQKIEALAAAGMRRASIGIQDFDPGIQKAIGRQQSYEQTREVVDMLRDAGITSLNTDIVYGLPHQTLEGIRRSTEQVLTLAPDRVALFGYAHVPWMAKRQRMIDSDALPDTRARLDLLEQTEAQFADAGFVALGIDHFALPGDSLATAAAQGRMRRNFQGYTDDSCAALIGLGASSISRFPGGYLQNAPGTAAYAGRILGGGFATSRGYRFTLEDRVRADLIERFLCDLSFDYSALEASYGTFAEIVRPDIDRALNRFPGWLNWINGSLCLAEGGKPLARLVAAEFDSFLKQGGARHSRAI
ncbi:oxygen-independent coproporphyrinogen III oxidase [Oceanibium sediminis]|uniref:oxygen-independent coproporphyrinogen III oxidase n=1 Tax=Oceanibium sediminis TaxID=2026339 RepID=UPI000DD4DBF9|nr:oxygen-independent coproporphyrinogen III oxidase [Oceanibium sediminis]